VNRVGAVELIVHAIEQIFFVALVVEHYEFRRIEKAASVQTAYRDEVPPVLATVRKFGFHVGCSERPVRSAHTAVRGGHALTGPRGRYNHNAGLASVFRRRRPGDHRQGFDRIDWKLVGKDLALLVSNWLAVDAERIRGVVADPVEEAIGIGSNPRC
jgi:hypothetical protein